MLSDTKDGAVRDAKAIKPAMNGNDTALQLSSIKHEEETIQVELAADTEQHKKLTESLDSLSLTA